MEFTFYGHACFEIEVGEKKLLFDPFISPNALAKDIDVSKIDVDYILLTHGHEDHVADVETISKQSGATVIANYEIIQWFGQKGVQGHAMNHGGKWTFDFGTVKMVQAVHTSSMPDGSYGGEAAGFVVMTPGGNFYVAGDTALHYDMKLIAEICKLDFAVLPIGDNFTMGYEDAVTAAKFVQCDKIIAVHYDTFPYIVVDHEKVQSEFELAGKEIHFLEIGESITL